MASFVSDFILYAGVPVLFFVLVLGLPVGAYLGASWLWREVSRPHEDASTVNQYSALSIIAYLVAAPLLGLGLSMTSAPLPYLVSFGVVALAVAVIAWWTESVLQVAIVSVVVLATMHANITLGGGRPYPALVGRVHVVVLPAFVAGVYVLREFLDGWRPQAGIWLGLFGLSSLGAVATGAASDPQPVFWFLFRILVAFIVFLTVQRAISTGRISLHALILTLVGATVAHGAWAIIQMRVGKLGMTHLGEAGFHVLDTVALPVIGVLRIGPHTGGLAGYFRILTGLAILALPVAVALYFSWNDRRRLLAAGVGVFSAVLVALSLSDAGRGAAAVSLLCVLALLSIRWWRGATQPTRSRAATTLILVVALIGVAVVPAASVFAPSSPSPSSGTPTEDSSSTPGAGKDLGGEASGEPSASVAGVDLSNLGPRVEQVTIGIKLWSQSPIVGIGVLNFVYDSLDYGARISHNDRGYPIHMSYIAILVGTGLLGFALFTAWVVAVLRRAAYAVASPTSGDLVAGVLAGVIGIGAFGVFNPLVINNATLTYPVVIFCAALVGSSGFD